MKGYMRQKYKVSISQKRISIALQVAAPQYHQRRQTNTARLTNPITYKADYFGRKLYIDQNEKLVMYGVTNVTAIDGHSRFVLCGVAMQVKNNQIIYEKAYMYIYHIHLWFQEHISRKIII